MQCFNYQLNPAMFGSKYSQVLLLKIKISQHKSCRGFIQLHFSCFVLHLIRDLTYSKSALNIAIYTESKLKISGPENCSSFISKMHYCTSKSPKRKVVGLIFLSNFRFRHTSLNRPILTEIPGVQLIYPNLSTLSSTISRI